MANKSEEKEAGSLPFSLIEGFKGLEKRVCVGGINQILVRIWVKNASL